VNIQVIQNQSISIDPLTVEKLVVEFTNFHHVKFDEATIHFVNTSKISKLHKEYFDDPTTTDCISFPMDDEEEEGYRILGDVFICPETAASFVEKNGGELYQEITLYVVHGLLHLLGYDDIEDEDKAEMRAEETRFLKIVAEKSLWIQAIY
jgi:probable rRNA maturation factor